MKRALFVAVACLLSTSVHAQLASDTAFVRFSGDTVRIWHINLTGYCEARHISTVEVRSDTIVVVESDTSWPHPRCTCLYDISTDLVGLPPKSYTAVIYYANRQSPAEYDTVRTRWSLAFTGGPGRPPLSVSSSASDCHSGITPAWTPATYPLQVGNVWDYVEDLLFRFQTSIQRDTVMPNGHRYAETGWHWSQQYQRQQGDSVLEYLPFENAEYLLFDFARSPGDTVFDGRARYGDTTSMVLTSTGIMELFGRTLRTWTFYRDTRPSIDDEVTITIVDSIGPYEFLPSFGPWLRLRGARIDGKVYGSIDALENPQQAPAAFALLGNYPNPFNPSTIIRYTVGGVRGPGSGASNIKVVVYNLLGREVVVLVNERKPAGRFTVEWDGRDAQGRQVSSGVYLYRMTAGSFTQTKRMLLIR